MTLDFMSYVDEGKVIFATVIESIIQANRGRGVLSGCNVSINTSQLAVDVSDGIVVYDGVHYDVSGKTLVLQVADATKDRLDVVVWDRDNGLTVLTGVDWLYDSSGNYIPKTVRISETQIPLAVVKVPAGATAVGEVYDVRSSVFEKKMAKSSVYLDSESVVQVRSDEMLVYHFPRKVVNESSVLDNSGGGIWYWKIVIGLSSPVLEDCNYLIEIDGTVVNVYNAAGDLKISGGISANFWSKVKEDGSDIRLTNGSGQIYFWIEKWDYLNQYAKIWVNLTAGSTEINIVYGNSLALPSSYNNGTETLELCEDFEDNSFTDQFTQYGTASGNLTFTVDEGNVWLRFYPNAASTWIGILSKKVFKAGDYVLLIYYNNVAGSTGERLELHKYKEDTVIVIQIGVYSSDAATGTYKVKKTITFNLSVDEQVGIRVTRGGWDADYRVDYVIIAKLADPATFTNITEGMFSSTDYGGLVSGDGSISGNGLFWGYML